MTDTQTTQPERMKITRVFDAPPALLWKAWTEPKYVAQWWGPKGFTSPSCQMDFRVGGKYLFCMKSPDGQEFWNAGEYHEIIPHQKIAATMFFADAQGNRVNPAHYGIEHEAIDDAPDIITFEDLGNNQTRVTFLGNESMKEATKSGQVEGMNQVFDKVAAVVGTLVQAK